MDYNKIFLQTKEIVSYIKNNNDYLENIDEKFSEFKSQHKSIYFLVKNKQMDLELFLHMILIKIKVQNKEITNEEGDREFYSIFYKKCNMPELSDYDLQKISQQYKIPYNKLKEEYTNLKN